MIRTAILALAFGAGVATELNAQQTYRYRSEGRLAASGEVAREHAPPCASGQTVLAAKVRDVLVGVGASVLGFGAIYEAAAQVPEIKSRVQVALGVHDGKSSCQTLCIRFPRTSADRFEACFQQVGPSTNYHCGTPKAAIDQVNGDWNFARVKDASVVYDGNTGVYCATGMNWSDNRSRRWEIRVW